VFLFDGRGADGTRDFETGVDRIDVSGARPFADLKIRGRHGDAMVGFEGDEIVLEGVRAGWLGADDLLFGGSPSRGGRSRRPRRRPLPFGAVRRRRGCGASGLPSAARPSPPAGRLRARQPAALRRRAHWRPRRGARRERR